MVSYMIFNKKNFHSLVFMLLAINLSNAFAADNFIVDPRLAMSPSLGGVSNATESPEKNIDTSYDPKKIVRPSGSTVESNLQDRLQEAKSETAIEERVVGRDESKLKSEFQAFVAQSIGQTLPMFGFDLFSKEAKTFAPVNNIPVTPDYTIGPGDELNLRVWGQVEITQNLVVDRNGMISIPKVGQVSVVGVRYQNLQSHIKAAIGQVFRNFELDVSLGKLRSIQVFVVGQAMLPGNYTVSSLSTLVNALFASGGPSVKGSMRHIQLKRSGKVITDFDIYDLLLKGDKSKDVQLLSGDVIYIPNVGPMAAVAGSVNTPAIYELRGNESLSDLLSLSGGLTNVAAGKKVTLERIRDRGIRAMDAFQLDSQGLAEAIHDGDLVTVRSISPEFENAVTLRGQIAGLYAGRHPWQEGLRITDIIPNKSALLTDSYWTNQNQVKQDGEEKKTLLRDNIGEINWDYASIERLNKDDLTTKLITFNLGKAMLRDDEQNLALQAGDVITLFSKNEILTPLNKRSVFVTIQGEVSNPGIYQALPGETLRQLFQRVGKPTPQGFLNGAEFARESTRQEQQKRLDQMTERMEAEISRTATRRSSTAMNSADQMKALEEAKVQQGLVKKMKQVKATGRIVLELPEDATDAKDLPDIALEDGDKLFIPSRASIVSVMGTVYNQNTFIYKDGRTVKDYLQKSGGPTKDGDEDEVYLVRASGLVMSKRQISTFAIGSFNGVKVMAGDTIVVPEKLERYNLTKELASWSQVFYQFAVGISALKNLGIF
jgi:protein involved in polysaccharide export with SLBB domain